MHFGQPILVQIPPVAVPALLSYFSTKSALAIAPLSSAAGAFDTRAEANAVASHGPTREDINVVNSQQQMTTSCDGSSALPSSRTRDADWARAVQFLGPSPILSLHLLTAHKLGALTGSWKGTSIVGDIHFCWRKLFYLLLSPIDTWCT
jgi:hypothetical protein